MRHPPPRRQRGAALLTAMIIVTLVTTLASAMVWQQWRAVQVESAERSRAQAAWILSGALDFAKLIIRENRGQTTDLSQPWATPLAESRISTFLAVDKTNPDDGPEAFLSGNIDDAQARFNLAGLVTSDRKPDPAGVVILQNLCTAVNIESGVAQRIATGLAQASANSAAGPLRPATVDQLTWLGIDAASVQALKPYVVLMQQRDGSPVTSQVNVNTASAQVLQAVTGLDPATAERMVTVRQRTPFTGVPVFMAQAFAASKTSATDQSAIAVRLSVRSDLFEVQGRLRLSDRVLVERSLLQRPPNGGAGLATVLNRERVASVE